MALSKIEKFVARLDEIDGRDGEKAHIRADEVLLDYVHPAVKEAYERLAERAAYWAHA